MVVDLVPVHVPICFWQLFCLFVVFRSGTCARSRGTSCGRTPSRCTGCRSCSRCGWGRCTSPQRTLPHGRSCYGRQLCCLKWKLEELFIYIHLCTFAWEAHGDDVCGDICEVKVVTIHLRNFPNNQNCNKLSRSTWKRLLFSEILWRTPFTRLRCSKYRRSILTNLQKNREMFGFCEM